MRPFIHSVARETILTTAFVFVLAASVAAAPQRGGGVHSGGGGPHGHFDGGHFRGPHGHVFIRGGFYDPFWWPYYPFGYGFPYEYGYPASVYGYSMTSAGNVRTEVTPRQTQVYVDGYYAGVADDFDGVLQRLHTSPGGHALTLRLEGYRTVTQNIYVRPDSTFKLKETMEKLAPGEVSGPVPVPKVPAGRVDSLTPAPDGGSAQQR